MHTFVLDLQYCNVKYVTGLANYHFLHEFEKDL